MMRAFASCRSSGIVRGFGILHGTASANGHRVRCKLHASLS
jgi:hypothetical protein